MRISNVDERNCTDCTEDVMSVIVVGERSAEEPGKMWLYNAREHKKARKKEKASRPRLRPLLVDMTSPTTQITPDRKECARLLVGHRVPF